MSYYLHGRDHYTRTNMIVILMIIVTYNILSAYNVNRKQLK